VLHENSEWIRIYGDERIEECLEAAPLCLITAPSQVQDQSVASTESALRNTFFDSAGKTINTNAGIFHIKRNSVRYQLLIDAFQAEIHFTQNYQRTW
jgi:hypothetical protein